jgi:hypothetical protein
MGTFSPEPSGVVPWCRGAVVRRWEGNLSRQGQGEVSGSVARANVRGGDVGIKTPTIIFFYALCPICSQSMKVSGYIRRGDE